MRRIAAALMLVASTSAHAQTLNPADPIPGVVQSATPVYDPVEIQPKDIPSIGKAETPTFLGDDATQYVDLGFTFSYFGQDFTKAWVSSNGFVSFQSGNHLCCNGQPLQNAQRNTIYEYWTDLINWSGTPYYSKKVLDDGTNAFLVGWYGTYEYGTNRPNSFEMTLLDGGGILFNYLETFNMQGHTITAGLTGPTASDNILLYTGSDTSTLSQKAYAFNFETGTVTTVDCNITPSDPSCPTQAVDIPGVPTGAPDVTPDTTGNTVQQVEQTIVQEISSTETVANPSEEQQTVAAIEQTIDTEQQVAAQVVEQVTAASEQAASEQQVVAVVEQQQTAAASTPASISATKETSTKSAGSERLSLSQLAILNSGGLGSSEISQAGQSSSSMDTQQSGDASANSSMQLFTNASNSSIAMAEAEQQQQLQSSIDSSNTSSIQNVTSSNEVQLVDTASVTTEVSVASSADVKVGGSSTQVMSNENDIKIASTSQTVNTLSEIRFDTAIQQVSSNDIKSDTTVQVTSIDTDESSKVATTQLATTETKSDNIIYQDQQKVASNTDSTSKDSNAFMQQALQAEQVIIVDTSQQSGISSAQQVDEDKTVAVAQVEVQQSSVASAEGRWQESIASQSAALEALNTINNQSSDGSQEQSPSSLGEGQGEVISQMAYVAGFSAYKLVSLPDRPDFYKPRRIYKNNRPVDAYMSIFKMTAANDSLWKQMVESQYE